MDKRTAGAKAGALAQGNMKWPTATGMAIRLRADDVDVGRPTQGGRRRGKRECELCGKCGMEGDHVLRCQQVGKKCQQMARAAVKHAAAGVPLVESELTPTRATAEVWAAAAKAAGGEGATAGMGTAEVATNAHRWAAKGWGQQDEWRERLPNELGSEDLTLIAWRAVAIRRASEEADEEAGKTAEEGGARDAGDGGRVEAEQQWRGGRYGRQGTR